MFALQSNHHVCGRLYTVEVSSQKTSHEPCDLIKLVTAPHVAKVCDEGWVIKKGPAWIVAYIPLLMGTWGSCQDGFSRDGVEATAEGCGDRNSANHHMTAGVQAVGHGGQAGIPCYMSRWAR